MTIRAKTRREKIAALVAERGQVSVAEIVELFGASHETVRRDLTALEDAGMLLKVHGGAKRAPSGTEGPFDQRMGENRAAKQIIAQKFADWLAPNQLIFVDTGTTTLIAMDALRSTPPGLQVVTNSIMIATALAGRPNGPEVLLLGGRVEGDNRETVGATTIEEIGRFNARCAVITVGALSAADGASDYSLDEALIARAMIAQAAQTVILADRSKFDRSVAFQVCPLSAIDVLISDAPPGAALASALSASGARVL